MAPTDPTEYENPTPSLWPADKVLTGAAMRELQDIINKHVGKYLHPVCQTILDTPIFANAYGSAGGHHAYPGGLIVHTSEVARYAMHMAEMFPCQVDLEVVAVAALFHDFLKIREYEPFFVNEEFRSIHKTDYRNLVRHVAGSFAQFVHMTAHLDEWQLSVGKRIKIEHALLAHHGRKEWGSPIEPQLVEAFIVHFADTFSQRFGPNSNFDHDS